MSKEDRDSLGGKAQWQYRLLYLGSLMCVVSAPTAYVLVRALPPSLVDQWGVIPVPQPSVEIRLRPPLRPGFELSEWIAEIVASIVVAAMAVGGLLSVVSSILGMVVVVGGMAVFRRPRALARIGIGLLETRGIKLLLVWYGVLGGSIIAPELLWILTQLSILVIVSGSLFLAIGAIWLWLRDSQQLLVRVAIVYPLGVGIVPLPLVGFLFVSPTTRAAMQAVTLEGAVFVLDTVLVVGGLNSWFRSTFTLVGVNWFILWVGLFSIFGWGVGLLVEWRRARC